MGRQQTRTARTIKKQKQDFTEYLRETANVTASCRAANIARRTAYEWKSADPEFSQQWEEALDEALDDIEQKMFERARGGVSDTAAIFLLKAHRPERYKERGLIEHTGHIAHDHVHTAIPATDRFITEAITEGKDRTPKKSLPH